MQPSFAQIRFGLQASVLGCVLALTACASLPPPTGELNAARQAVSRAGDADADQYAAAEIGQARNALAAAQAAMAAGREDDARTLASRATAQADLARARSEEASVQNALSQRRAEITDLRQRLRLEDQP